MIASTRWPRAVFLIVGMAASTAGCDGPATSVAHTALYTLPRNGLLPAALEAPETQGFLPALTTAPLSTDTLSPYEASIGSSANLQAVMPYIVSCALDQGVEVEVAGETWPGELGLCGASSPFGNWGTAAPGEDCQEVVSSCVLARMNAHGYEVVLSFRGEPNWHFPLQPRVPVERAYRESGNTLIESFGSLCPIETEHGDPSRGCEWSARFVGSCTPDQDVTLGVPAGAMLRLCKGIYGCNHMDAPAGAPWYAGWIGSYGASMDRVTFRCPRNGVSLRDRGYFSVMLALPDPASELDELDELVDGHFALDVHFAGGAGTYPSLEKEVFTYREGAFFGNIFVPYQPDPKSPDDVLVAKQYACYSEVWDDGIAALADRLCAGPESPCFANAPRACLFQPRDPDMVAEDPSCRGQSAGEQQDYLDCKGGTSPRVWTHPITVFLNHPCDLARDTDSCKKARFDLFTPNNW